MKRVKNLIRKAEEEEKVEEKNQTSHIIHLIEDPTSQEDLKRIAEEKSQLIVVSHEKIRSKLCVFSPSWTKLLECKILIYAISNLFRLKSMMMVMMT